MNPDTTASDVQLHATAVHERAAYGDSEKHICIVTPEINGPNRNDGVGTACEAIAQVLANAGHNVTILYSRGYCPDPSQISTWIDEYARQGISLVWAPRGQSVVEASNSVALSWHVWRWLKPKQFDLIYVVGDMGNGFFSLAAKWLGLAFRDTPIVVGTHGPTAWFMEGNRQLPGNREVLGTDYMERTSVALADAVISPSQHMLDWLGAEKWSVPKRAIVLRNPVPLHARSSNQQWRRSHPVSEIVFFGRLEPRKGITLFTRAIARLPIEFLLGVSVTFLGKRTDFDLPLFLDTSLRGRVVWTIIDGLDSAKAVAYLSTPGRIAVIASRTDNSPFTVVECIAKGIPFLASSVGGIPELLHPDDHEGHLFPPEPAGLARVLERALIHGLTAARPAMEAAEIDTAWLNMVADLTAKDGCVSGHPDAVPAPQLPDSLPVDRAMVPGSTMPPSVPEISVVLIHYNRPGMLRQALDGLMAQTVRNFEVVLVDDGSDQPEALNALAALEENFAQRGWQLIRQANRWGTARNTGWRAAKGRFILFHDDDNVAMPNELATLIGAAHRSGADILTCVTARFSGDRPPQSTWQESGASLWVPIGGCVSLGLFENCFGDANALVRRDVLEKLGGFTEEYGVSYQDWEFFARAALAGYSVVCVPEPLIWYRVSADSVMRRVPENDADYYAVARPYTDLVPFPLRYALLEAIASERRLGVPFSGSGETEAARHKLAALYGSTSWRMSWPIRWLGVLFGRARPVKLNPQSHNLLELRQAIMAVETSRSWRAMAPLRSFKRKLRHL
jgi:glycosyltransferase involved in cell wall biosynthesis